MNEWQWIAQMGRILGTLFYHSPESSAVQRLLPWLQQGLKDDPFLAENAEKWSACFQQAIEQNQLSEQYQQLFIGPNVLLAPPWGSVYLDKESVLFGSSLTELRQFLFVQQITPQGRANEPEDHFGLMLYLSAYLAEQQSLALKPFLAQHFLPWAYRYLALLAQTDSLFYLTLGELTEQVLHQWQTSLNVSVIPRELYR